MYLKAWGKSYAGEPLASQPALPEPPDIAVRATAGTSGSCTEKIKTHKIFLAKATSHARIARHLTQAREYRILNF